MYRNALVVVVAWMSLATPIAAFAQADVRANEWSRGTDITAFAGAAMESSDAAPLIGGAMGWQLTPALGIEGSGGWLDRGHGRTAFAGALQAHVRLFRARKVDPFGRAGIGLHRAEFASNEPSVPDFYRRRMMASLGAGSGRTFTDPTVVAGGGLNVPINRHLALRPDAGATVVFREGRTHVVTTIAVHAVYHFESHAVTPLR